MPDTQLQASGSSMPPPGAAATVQLPVTGMTCAACQARVQRAPGRTPGVRDAAVNLMTGTAAVVYDPAIVTPAQLVAKVRDTGYGSDLPSTAASAAQAQEARERQDEAEYRDLRL